jgi:hypothetical protein
VLGDQDGIAAAASSWAIVNGGAVHGFSSSQEVLFVEADAQACVTDTALQLDCMDAEPDGGSATVST